MNGTIEQTGSIEKTIIFKAYSVTNEFDLNEIAGEFGFKRKYRWEEPLIIKDKTLENVLKTECQKDQRIMVFAFGVIVFINIAQSLEHIFIEYLRRYKSEINSKELHKYNEKYELHVVENGKIWLEDKYVTVPEDNLFYSELVAMVIAKSVALDRTEEQLEKILDNVEGIIDRLEKGNVNISNKKLANSASQILRHEYNSIAYIMILDKPEITWNNSDADYFYKKVSSFYELESRYETIKEKTDILNNIVEGFTTISHSVRGFVLEWIIVILIVFEVIMMALELFK